MNIHPLAHKATGPSKNGHLKLNHPYMDQGSPRLHISRALLRSLHHHPSAAMATYAPPIQPNLGLHRTRLYLPPASTSFSSIGTLHSLQASNHLNQGFLTRGEFPPWWGMEELQEGNGRAGKSNINMSNTSIFSILSIL